MNDDRPWTETAAAAAITVSGTVYTSRSWLSKSFSAGPTGEIVKTTGVQFAGGEADRFDLKGATAEEILKDFGDVLNRLNGHQAIGLGVEKSGARKVQVTTKAKSQSTGLPSRSLDHWHYPEGHGLFLADYDDGTGFNAKAAAVYPAWADVATLTRASVSAGISNPETGETLGPKGEHVYAVIDDVRRSKEVATALDRLFWKEGHGHVRVAANGALLRRSPVDLAVFSPERVSFEGPARVQKPIVAPQRECEFRPGGVLCAADLIAYADERISREAADALFHEACQDPAVKAESVVKRTSWRKGRIEELVAHGESLEAAAEAVDRFLDSGRLSAKDGQPFYSYELPLDFPITLDDGKTVTPREIGANPKKWAGRTLPDPIEGASYGLGKARIMAGEPSRGGPYIRSFAHGLCVYQFATSEEEGAEPDEKKKKRKMGTNLLTARRLMQKSPDLQGLVSYDLFNEEIVLERPIPRPDYEVPKGWEPRPFSDIDATHLAEVFLARDLRGSFARLADEVVRGLAKDVCKHPVRDYLNAIEWDGTERLSNWLKDFAGAILDPDDEEQIDYIEAISRASLIGAVARVMQPGCKHDHVLTLIGPQGFFKSTLFRALVPNPKWFSDSITRDLGDKDAMVGLAGIWIAELSELASLNKTDFATAKAFLTRQEDKFRPPHGRCDVRRARQVAFFATANHPEPFRDETGNRRFWPVSCTTGDPDTLAKVRDQLWAEAVVAYRAGEAWWLGRDLETIAQVEQAKRVTPHALVPAIRKVIGVQNSIEIAAILEAWSTSKSDWTRLSMDVARALREMGWEKSRRRKTQGERANRWYSPHSREPLE